MSFFAMTQGAWGYGVVTIAMAVAFYFAGRQRGRKEVLDWVERQLDEVDRQRTEQNPANVGWRQ